MADNASSPRPAPFDRLPVELVRRIMEDVREQDKAFGSDESRLYQARPVPADGLYLDELDSGEEEEDFVEDVPGGRWSATYGRGVEALSMVCKSMRELALPLLFETVKLGQLNRSTFVYDVVETPSCSLIQHLDMRDWRYWRPDELDAAIESFQHLSAVKAVSFDCSRPVPYLKPVPALPGSEIEGPTTLDPNQASRSFHALVAKVTEVRLQNFSEKTAAAVLCSPVLPTTLETLRLSHRRVGGGPEDLDPKFWAAVQALSLKALILESSVASYGVAWGPGTLSFPSLRTLALPFSYLGDGPLSVLQQLAPNVVSLTLSDIKPSTPTRPTVVNGDGPPSVLPHLTSLHLIGRSTSSFKLIPLFSACPLLHSIDVTPPAGEVSFLSKLVPSLDDWPTALRSFHLRLTSFNRPRDLHTFPSSNLFRTAGIAVTVAWTPARSLDLTGTTSLERRLKKRWKAVQDDLEWASGEADELCFAEDEAGMDELVRALRRLREKRILKLQ